MAEDIDASYYQSLLNQGVGGLEPRSFGAQVAPTPVQAPAPPPALLTTNPVAGAPPAVQYPEGRIGTGDEHLARSQLPAALGEWNAGVTYNSGIIPQGFNWQDYTRYNADLATAGIDTEEEARRHYALYGANEGRRLTNTQGVDDWGTKLTPTTYVPARFNWQEYIQANPGLAQTGIDTEAEARRHYAAYGRDENRTGTGVPTNTVTPWQQGIAAPTTSDGREYVTWGGDKNIQGQTYYVNPDVADYLYNQLVRQRDAMQGSQYRWTSGEKGVDTPDEFIRDMALNLAASGVTDLRDVGRGQGEVGREHIVRGGGDYTKYLDEGYYRMQHSGGPEGDTTYTRLTPEEEARLIRDGETAQLAIIGDQIINKATGKPIISQYGGRTNASQGLFGGTYRGAGNTGYQVMFDEQGNPYFRTAGASSSDIGEIMPILAIASLIPGVAPFARGIMGLIAADQGNPLAAIASFAGAVPGLNNVMNLGLGQGVLDASRLIGGGAQTLGALQSGNTLGAASSLLGMAPTANAALDLGLSQDTLNNLGRANQGLQAVNAYNRGDLLGAVAGGANALGTSIPYQNELSQLARGNQLLQGIRSGSPLSVLQAAQAFRPQGRAAGGLIPEGAPDKVEAARILRNLPPDQARMLSGIAANI